MVNSKRLPPVGIGVITVLTVLLVLTLSVFSALTLSSARADLALSRRNAENVTAYYTADAKAAALYSEFAAGSQEELETTVPISEQQDLYLHFVRENGLVRILAWQTVTYDGGLEEGGPGLWDGTLSG